MNLCTYIFVHFLAFCFQQEISPQHCNITAIRTDQGLSRTEAQTLCQIEGLKFAAWHFDKHWRQEVRNALCSEVDGEFNEFFIDMYTNGTTEIIKDDSQFFCEYGIDVYQLILTDSLPTKLVL